MGLGYVSVVKNAAKLGNVLMPFLVICGLLAIWVLIVIICLWVGQVSALPIGGELLLQ